MFEQGTVFVVGAGGSHDLNLPVGVGLLDHIVNLMNVRQGDFTDGPVRDAMKKLAGQRSADWQREYVRWLGVASRLTRALTVAPSIDNFLHTHQNDEDMKLLGKLGIVRSILQVEENSYLRHFISPDTDPTSFKITTDAQAAFKKSWYMPLIRLLFSTVTLANLPNLFANVSFITFNYDRCLEHFLHDAIMRFYMVNANTAQSIMSSLHIIHIYGVAGSLPWMEKGPYVDFGEWQTDKLIDVSENIQTFTESANSRLVDEAHYKIENARTLVFMGFGFLPQNMEVLQVHRTAASRLFMTSYGISASDRPIVEQQMHSMLGQPRTESGHGPRPYRTFTHPGTCAELMADHWVELTRQDD